MHVEISEYRKFKTKKNMHHTYTDYWTNMSTVAFVETVASLVGIMLRGARTLSLQREAPEFNINGIERV